MHSFHISKESHFDNDTLIKIQAGKLDFTRDGKTLGYSLIKLNTENSLEDGEIFFRKWDTDSSKFEKWTERAKDGKISFTTNDAIPFDAVRFYEICKNKSNTIERDLICNVGLAYDQQRKLSDVFVCPSLVWDTSTGESQPRKRITNDVIDSELSSSIDEILSKSDSLILLGGEHSGKSTLAKRIAISFLNTQAKGDCTRIIFYLDTKGSNLDKPRKIRDSLLNFYLEDQEATQALEGKLGRCISGENAVIVIDSCEGLSPSALRALSKFIHDNPGAKYILCAQLSATTALREFVEELSPKLKFKFGKVSGLTRSHIRELFGKWNPSSATKNNHAVNQALKNIEGAGMPNNPFVYSMLLSIKERKATSYRSFMHEADLIENFIEIMLEKHVFTNRNAPQYKDLLLFLGYLASKMQKSDSFVISENEMTASIHSFNTSISQSFQYNGYIDPLKKCGILKERNQSYSFSQVCFFNYSLAHWFCKTSINYKDLDSSLSILRFDKVFEYISAIKKNDFELLDHLKLLTNRAWSALVDSEKLGDVLSIDEEISNCVSHDLFDLIDSEGLEKTITKNAPTQEELDEQLDEKSPLRTDPVSEIRQEDDGNSIPSIHFRETLSLYARAFRAAEHLMNADYSSEHFSTIFLFYMKAASMDIRAFDQRLRPAITARVLKLLKYDDLDNPNKEIAKNQVHAYLNFIISAIPNWNVAMMSCDFLNMRQIRRIEDNRQSAKSNMERLIWTYALCDIEGVDVTSEIQNQKCNKIYESSSLIIKIVELIWSNFSITSDEKKSLESKLGKILKDRRNSKMFGNVKIVTTIISENDEAKNIELDLLDNDQDSEE